MSEAKQTAKLALEALEDKKAMDVRILDITHVSTLADYFMIASGSNRNQVQAMAGWYDFNPAITDADIEDLTKTQDFLVETGMLEKDRKIDIKALCQSVQ